MDRTVISNYSKLGLTFPLNGTPDKIYYFRLFEICESCGSHVPSEGYKCLRCVECIGYQRQFLTTPDGYVEVIDKRNVMSVINDRKGRYGWKFKCLNDMKKIEQENVNDQQPEAKEQKRRQLMAKILDVNVNDHIIDMKSIEFCKQCHSHVPTFGIMCPRCPIRSVIIDEIVFCDACDRLPTSDTCQYCVTSVRTTIVAERILHRNYKMSTLRYAFSRNLSCLSYDYYYSKFYEEEEDYDENNNNNAGDFNWFAGNVVDISVASLTNDDNQTSSGLLVEDQQQIPDTVSSEPIVVVAEESPQVLQQEETTLNDNYFINDISLLFDDPNIFYSVTNQQHIRNLRVDDRDDYDEEEEEDEEENVKTLTPINYKSKSKFIREPLIYDTKFGFVHDDFVDDKIYKLMFSLIHDTFTTVNRYNVKRVINEFCVDCLSHVPTLGLRCAQCFYVRNKHREIIYPVTFCDQHRLCVADDTRKSCSKCKITKYLYINDVSGYYFETLRRRRENRALALQYKRAKRSGNIRNAERIKRCLLNVSDTLYAVIDNFRIWFNSPSYTRYSEIDVLHHYVNKILAIKSKFYFCSFCYSYLPYTNHESACPCKYKFNVVKRILKNHKRCRKCDFDVARCDGCLDIVVPMIKTYIESKQTTTRDVDDGDDTCHKCQWKLERCEIHNNNTNLRIRYKKKTAKALFRLQHQYGYDCIRVPPRKRLKIFS